MQPETYHFHSNADGARIVAYAWRTDDAPRGTVLIAHGLAEHALRYKRFADALTGAGFAVYAHDHRGHGASLLEPGALGEAGEAGWFGLVTDLTQHAALVRERHAGLPLVLFGHSMGSFAAQHFLVDHGDTVNGVILSGSTDIGAVAAMIAESGKAPSFADYNAAFEPARTPFDWLSRDEAEVDAYVADPLCGFDAPEPFAASMLHGANEYADPERLEKAPRKLPILFVAGDKDPLNGGLMLLNSLVQKYRAAGFADIETQFYADGRHEMLNELNREEVTADILSWLQNKID